MNSIYCKIDWLNQLSIKLTSGFDSLGLLVLRLYVSTIFIKAGWLKLKDWDTTLFLFEEEYQVPVLPPELAAWAGTFGEIVFPFLLIVGLLSRYAALGLFVVNIVAVYSLAEIAPAALASHITWGLAMAGIVIWGPGSLSIDKLLTRFGNKRAII